MRLGPYKAVWLSPSSSLSGHSLLEASHHVAKKPIVQTSTTSVAKSREEMMCPCQVLPKLQIREQSKCYCWFKQLSFEIFLMQQKIPEYIIKIKQKILKSEEAELCLFQIVNCIIV